MMRASKSLVLAALARSAMSVEYKCGSFIGVSAIASVEATIRFRTELLIEQEVVIIDETF